jgi:glycosyltransferase involved in cell wall biosynthesis
MNDFISKKVLFLALHRPNRSPSQRYRFEQYLKYLEQNGFECHYSWLISENDDEIFYASGKAVSKTVILMKSLFKRWKETLQASKYVIVFVQRECFMLGTAFFEKQFARKTKLIFDFDDSIWITNVSEANKRFGFLKSASKTKEILAVADLVLAGNSYLANYAGQFNKHVEVFPSTIDTDAYIPAKRKDKWPVCIGWSGSFSTIQHFQIIIPVLEKLKKKYREKICIKVYGDGNYKYEALGIRGISWSPDGELKELNEMDIGLMPLPEDEWTNGKCGMKGLIYMSLEIPAIMSPVGVNTEIISSGENGFLAAGPDEWMGYLSMLIEDFGLRNKLGQNGRKTVMERYSVRANRDKYLGFFRELTS